MISAKLKSTSLTMLINFGVCFSAYPAIDESLIQLSATEKVLISKRIWQNEAGGTIEGLTHWNTNEGFASLGIGHFIWFPEGKEFVFKESFPSLIQYILSRGVDVPDWLINRPCPSPNQKAFRDGQNSEKMKTLRRFLASTLNVQFEFIVQRSQEALLKMIVETNEVSRKLIKNYQMLTRSPEGMYALIDYTNFKGEGVLSSEQYKGKGWGLRDVLLNMGEYSDDKTALLAFSESAKFVLRRRVKNGPAGEARWLAPWLTRVSAYTQTLRPLEHNAKE